MMLISNAYLGMERFEHLSSENVDEYDNLVMQGSPAYSKREVMSSIWERGNVYIGINACHDQLVSQFHSYSRMKTIRCIKDSTRIVESDD